MEILGRVHNGMIVFDSAPSLPEGAAVRVVYPAAKVESPPIKRHRIRLPIVHCDKPGTIELTGEQVAEILDAEDATPRR